MRSRRFLSILGTAGAVAALALAAAMPVAAHGKPASGYVVTYLVSDGSVPAANPNDSDLKNGWGLTRGPATPWWVADNGTDKSTLYNGAGTKLGLVVSVADGPTGTVFNGGTGFLAGGAAARFIFVNEAGAVIAWQSALGTTAAEVAHSTDGAIYKGLAIGSVDGADYLYATDFHNGKVDVYNSAWTLQPWTLKSHHLPDGYAPFGIQNLNGIIFVTYAKQDADREDEIAGKGKGFVDAFLPNGFYLGRVASRGQLNAPWGLAWAPAEGFGRFSGDLIVGNFGDGQLNAYRFSGWRWHHDGKLRDANHKPIEVDGLWGIAFGAGNANSGPANSLYFAAGPNDEEGGSFGTITAP